MISEILKWRQRGRPGGARRRVEGEKEGKKRMEERVRPHISR